MDLNLIPELLSKCHRIETARLRSISTDGRANSCRKSLLTKCKFKNRTVWGIFRKARRSTLSPLSVHPQRLEKISANRTRLANASYSWYNDIQPQIQSSWTRPTAWLTSGEEVLLAICAPCFRALALVFMETPDFHHSISRRSLLHLRLYPATSIAGLRHEQAQM